MKDFFNRLFRKQPEPISEPDTRPLTADDFQIQLPYQHSAKLEPQQLIVGCAASIGKQRDHNEDSLFTATTTLSSNNGDLPFGFYIVADGMGGHLHGELASEIAIRAMASYVMEHVYIPLIGLKGLSPNGSIQEIMASAVQDAQRSIIQGVPGGGTTLTASLILGEQLTIAHVGDSRAYAISKAGEMTVVTKDHSLVKRLVDLGQITKEEAAVHPQRNVLYRALGQGEPVEPDIISIQVTDAAYLMLCSDGLWGVVPDDVMSTTILTAPNPEAACQKMVSQANDAGGPDNITVILIQLPD